MSNDEIIKKKQYVAEKLSVLGNEIDALGGYSTENAYKLVKLCDTFEQFFDDLVAIDSKNGQAIAFGYGEDVRRDSEWSTEKPSKKYSEGFLANRYNRGKTHLKDEIDMFIETLG
jgi:hypothetical protein